MKETKWGCVLARGWVQDKGENTGTFRQRGKNAQRKTDWWVVSGPRLLNRLRVSHLLIFFIWGNSEWQISWGKNACPTAEANRHTPGRRGGTWQMSTASPSKQERESITSPAKQGQRLLIKSVVSGNRFDHCHFKDMQIIMCMEREKFSFWNQNKI